MFLSCRGRVWLIWFWPVTRLQVSAHKSPTRKEWYPQIDMNMGNTSCSHSVFCRKIWTVPLNYRRLVLSLTSVQPKTLNLAGIWRFSMLWFGIGCPCVCVCVCVCHRRLENTPVWPQVALCRRVPLQLCVWILNFIHFQSSVHSFHADNEWSSWEWFPNTFLLSVFVLLSQSCCFMWSFVLFIVFLSFNFYP